MPRKKVSVVRKTANNNPLKAKSSGGDMLNIINHFRTRRVKRNLTVLANEYRLVFKKGSFNTILRAKGWKNKAEMARELGFTRAYLTQLEQRKVAVTTKVISRLAVALGSIRNGWGAHFELIPYGLRDDNHQANNKDKYDGIVPYKHNSLSAEFRRQDSAVETKEYE